MTAHGFADQLAPVQALEDLMARHGVLRVLMALPRALVQQRRATLLLERPVSYHIARDIGLSYDPPPKTPWEYR
jgi:hypothetical protein